MDSRIYTEKMMVSLRDHLDPGNYRFITYPKFVFLCGKANSPEEYDSSNRGVIHRYIEKKSKDTFIVLSEKLWEEGFNSNIDLLTFEDFLAEVSDAIVLFAESVGSFCELGAFSYADKLFCEKLIIVIDEKHKGEKSFILTGPTEKAKKDGATVVFAPLSGTGLLGSADLRSIIDRKIKEFSSKSHSGNKRKQNVTADGVLINTFILELLELIKILQPISKKDLIEIYKEIKGFSSFSFVKKNGQRFHNEIKVDYIYKLLLTVGLITIDDNVIRAKDDELTQSVMFKYSVKASNKERNILLCRRYRYGGVVI